MQKCDEYYEKEALRNCDMVTKMIKDLLVGRPAYNAHPKLKAAINRLAIASDATYLIAVEVARGEIGMNPLAPFKISR